MGAAKKLKSGEYPTEKQMKELKLNEEDKRYIQQYQAKIEELLKDSENQKKAAQIIHNMINKK